MSDVLWEYRPPRAHPILYAGLLVFGFVLVTGALEAVARGKPASLILVYAAPLAGTLLLLGLLMPGNVRIRGDGVEPGWRVFERPFRPRLLRWDDLAAVYPVHYDVTGAFVSPFASSDGKVTQMGLGLERRGGHVTVVRFTPSRFALGARSSRGYREAADIVRGLLADRGQPMVPPRPPIPAGERERLLREARKPFLPFFAIVLLLACAAPLVAILHWAGLDVGPSLAIAVVPPLATSFVSWTRSRQRNRILNLLSRDAEMERAASPPSATSGSAPPATREAAA